MPKKPVYGPQSGTPGDVFGRFQPVQSAISQGLLGNRVGSVPKPVAPIGPLSQSLMAGGTPISGPTGASMASAFGRPMSNEEAQANYANSPADSRYMPSQTVGGAFGQPGPVGGALAAHDQLLADRSRQQLAGNQIRARIEAANGPPPPPEDVSPRPGVEAMVRSGRYEQDPTSYSPFTLQPKGFGSEGYQRPTNVQAAMDLFDSRRGGTAQRQADYQQRRANIENIRKENVASNAFKKSEARRMRLGNTTFDERLLASNPGAVFARAQENVGLANAQAAQQNQAAAREFTAGQNQLNRENQTERAKIGAVGMAAAHGVPNPFAPSPEPTGPTTPPKIPAVGELSSLTPAQRQEATANLPPATRERVLNEADRKGFWSRYFGSLDQPKQVPVSKLLPNYGWANPLVRASAAMVNSPELVRPISPFQHSLQKKAREKK